ncbi:glycine betaine/L-proline transporter ProP [Bartonella sp. HY761]|uniref:glycine betaine/L-proline transporter ProP n=1 Tax=Bartonella sp. HY761 TaxID=2979330 RepID=UPI002203CFC2|nr:glycine betaine/L-proline transporter ProP [Bartonella sp. HY761]UXN05784.1 glycine betaine/L-proline transporter ProP [Bartonella sp. HY761]
MSQAEQQPLKVDDIPIVSNSELKKVISATGLGNAVEWFDFSVYGFLTVIIGKVFFADASPTMQLIFTLMLFSVPFLFRPLGGAIFGILGDKIGRKSILSFTIIMMSASTFCIGIIPSYEKIGLFAPFLLLLAKIIQGLSVGGEYSGAVVFVSEYSPDKKRGFLASWLDFGSIVGFLAGAGTVSLLSAVLGTENLESWGWRIPFLLSLPLGFIGLYLRKSLDESPTFQNLEESDRDNATSVKKIFMDNWLNIVLSCGIVIVTNTTYYMLLTYMPNYLEVSLHYNYDHSMLIIIIVMAFMLFIQPLVGFLSDKIGRKPFLVGGALALLILAVPSFWLIQHHNVLFIALGFTILALILCCFIGVMASVLPALFPTEVRFRTLAISFNISVMVAGITPPLAAYLVAQTGNLYMPAFYLMVVAVIGLVVGMKVHETANQPLMDAIPVASSRSEAKQVLAEHFDRIEENVNAIEDKISGLEDKKQEHFEKAEENINAIDDKISGLEDKKQEHFDKVEESISAIDDKIAELEEKRQELIDQHPKLS